MLLKNGVKDKLEIIAYHGWGFSSDFWDVWKKSVPSSVKIKTADRGYFFEKKSPVFSSNNRSLKLLFLHSFGAHWCPAEQLMQADIVIIFNGFKTFHPEDKREKNKSRLLLNRMINRFEDKPQQVLADFLANSFYPENKDITFNRDWDNKLLINDLKRLGESDFNLKLLSKNGKNVQIFSLEGGKDKILRRSAGKAFTTLTDQKAVYHFVKEAGHALPVTHTQDCWSFINAMIPIFIHNEYNREKKATGSS
ncbi:MAG: hypothetical protein FH748_08660 [Balneolaceae bacterium]|nr:hypothetical protein [Balneolaceae bacterium]